jgi:hypothetical protein
MVFEKGALYTRQQIAAEVGGGSLHDFLPVADGAVLCACLSQDFVPQEPVILVGAGPGVQRQAEIFRGQTNAVPLFFKKQANQWEYAGRFKCCRWSGEPDTIAKYADASGRTNLTGVVFLKEE